MQGIKETEQTGDKTFGGVAAEWRRWHYSCPSGKSYDIEQYEVLTAPAYVLSTRSGTGADHGALTSIAQHSRLPRPSAPLRLYDVGYVRTLTKTAGGYRVELDRVVYDRGAVVNQNPTTYSYVVPKGATTGDGNIVPKRGQLVEIRTNGSTVYSISVGDR